MRDKIYVTVIIAVSYVIGAQLGFPLALLPESPITIFWPSSGIALAALLLYGNTALPGVFIGALFSNASLAPDYPGAITTAAVILLPLGLTLGPLVAAALLNRFVPSAPIWASASDLMQGTAFIGLACLVSTSIGIATIFALGMLPQRFPFDAYGMWWLGEFCGMLMITSLAFLAGNKLFKSTAQAVSPGHIVSPSLVYSGFTAAALLGFISLWNQEGSRITQALEQEAEFASKKLTTALLAAGRDLKSIRALILAYDRADEEEFLRYTTAEFGARQDYPGAQAIGWAPRVTDPRDWEVKMLSLGKSESRLFEVNQSGDRVPVDKRPDYFPVEWVYPFDKTNNRAIGFDLGSESMRRAAIENARDTGELSMMAPIYLVQSDGMVPGMFMCWPIYLEGAPLQTVSMRREAMIGVASGVYYIGTVFDSAMEEFDADVTLHLFDKSQAGNEQLFYSRLSEQQIALKSEPLWQNLEDLTERISGVAAVSFAGHEWLVVATPDPTYVLLHRSGLPWGTLGLILALGAGIGSIMIERISAHRTVEKERRRTEEALHQAQAANESKSYFMAAASHDIKQPLYALGILTDTLLMTDPPESAKPIMKGLKNSIKEMSQHFDTLMDIGRFQDGSFEVRACTFSLRELARRISLEIGPLCRAKGLLWTINFDDVEAFSDPELLLRLIRNILINAVSYTDKGEVACMARRQVHSIVFHISDTGPGLSADQQHMVYSGSIPARNDVPHKTGFGLGLSIVQKISQSLGLQIQIATGTGEGTTFSFRLPMNMAGNEHS